MGQQHIMVSSGVTLSPCGCDNALAWPLDPTPQVGITTAPTFDDFLWANSIFWSRGLALPVTYRDPTQQQPQQEGDGSNGGSSGSNDGSGGSSGGVLRLKVLEGLVPGLDVANHSQQVNTGRESQDSKRYYAASGFRGRAVTEC